MPLLSALKSKFAVDSIFNLLSVLLLGVCGLLLNFVIAARYGPVYLGIFNLVYAFYVITSQVAALGIQVSCLKYVAEFSEDRSKCDLIITVGLSVVMISATVFSTAVYLSRGLVAWIMDSPNLTLGLAVVVPGLWCFTVNKVLLNILNGYREMKAYAFFTSLRYLILLAALMAAILIKLPGPYLPVIISAAEVLLLASLGAYELRKVFSLVPIWGGPWVKRHLSFGIKSLLGGILVEFNTRVDVLMLGYFTSEYWVGIYSFAAMLIEGFNQFPFVLRKNMDPILTKFITTGRLDELTTIIRRGKRLTMLGMTVVGLIGVAAYPLVVDILVGNPAFHEGWPVFMVLMIGLVLQAGYIPFSGILVQGGYPSRQTFFILSVCSVNILANALLIPWLGIMGAATATAASYLSTVVLLKTFTWRTLQIKI